MVWKDYGEMFRRGDILIHQRISKILKNYLSDIPEKHELAFTVNPLFGDYSSNIAFLLAKIKNRPAIEIANELSDKLIKHDEFSSVKVAGKGFVNFVLSDKLLLSEINTTLEQDFGRLDIGKNEKVVVEYISANPTGPLNVVQARAGAFGNALVNLLRFVNYDAVSEFYINNTGTQTDLLYESFLARMKELRGEEVAIPEQGYHGIYLKEIAQEFWQSKIPQEKWRESLISRMISMQKQSLSKFDINFDNFAEESSFISRRGLVIEKLKDFTYHKEGALWFRASDFNDTEDRVLITANGRPTYFLSDLAYHWDKFERGFKYLINIWGPDHHGYIARMRGGLAALGFDASQLIIIIAQQVSLLRNQEKIVMSKRAGEFITLDEVISEIGSDALKFFLLMRRASQHLEFDLALAKKTSHENPVYYVQYAYARINSILRLANEKNIDGNNLVDMTKTTSESERNLIKMIIRFPEVTKMSANNYEPHHLIYYLIDLATVFHKFYESVRVLTDDMNTSSARIFLCQATRRVIKDILEIIDVSAPEKM
jgi:arginyl-tRNA synthetase